MSFSSSQRRSQRRRLVASWMRSPGVSSDGDAEPCRATAAYDAAAHPERHRGPAVLLPTGLAGLAIAAAGILLPLVAATVAGSADHVVGRGVFHGGGRFAATLRAAGDLVDPRGPGGVQAWLAQVYLLLASGVALVVRLMRRHRRDDFRGGFRAWGWMAAVLAGTALAGAVPVGRLVAAAVTDSTGIAFGPGGVGWWLVLASGLVVAASSWAVLPLHERMGTGVWIGLAMAGWSASAAAEWLADGPEWIGAAGAAAWTLAAGFALVAMLAAARSVIREVRGQCGGRNPRTARAAKAEPAKAAPRPAAEDVDDVPALGDEAEPAPAEERETEYVDGSEREHRHLSKAERKRLRKLARMNGAA